MVNGEMNHVPSSLSKNCRDFISRVLTANPEKRPTVDEIINHRWLKEALDYRFVVGLFKKNKISKKIKRSKVFSYLIKFDDLDDLDRLDVTQ